MDGRRFFSGLHKLLQRKSSNASNTRSALTTRVPSSDRQSVASEDARCGDPIGDVKTKPTFEQRSELDRLVLEQGLTSPRTTSDVEKRQIHDKTYYMGLLFRKGYKVRSEVQKLLRECEKMRVDQMAYDGLKATAESKALELKGLQESLVEYNVVDEWWTTDKTLQDAKTECEELKTENADKSRELFALFETVKQKSETLQELETDFSQRDRVAEILTTTDAEELRERDRELRSELTQLEMKTRRLSSHRESLESRCDELGRGGAAGFLQELNSKESMRDTLRREQAVVSGKEDFLLKKKEYSDLVRCIREQLKVVKDQIDKAKSDLDKEDSDGGDRVGTISKLKNRERILESFFESYPSRKAALLSECIGHRRTVLSLLEDTSWKLNSFGVTPEELRRSLATLMEKESLEDKLLEEVETLKKGLDRGELRGSLVTLIEKESLGENKTLKKELDRGELRRSVATLMEKESLEDKLLEEVEILKKELERKEKEMAAFSDIEGLKSSLTNRKRELESELDLLKSRRESWKGVLKSCQEGCDSLWNQQKKCKVRAELSKLEKRWHVLEEENFSLKEWLEEEKVKGDYSGMKRKVLSTIRELNEGLVASHGGGL